MLCHELTVEQAEATLDEARHEMDQRHLRRVAFAAEHALAEEGRANRDAVEAADEFIADPAFDAVGVAAVVQFRIKIDDRVVDPAFRVARARFGTGAHDLDERGIGADGESFRADGAGEAGGEVEAVERQHRTQPGIEPMELGVVAALAQGKDADAIGLQENVGRDLQHRRGYFLRPTSFSSQWMS